MASDTFPRLAELFRNHSSAYERIANGDPSEAIRHRAEALLERARCHSIRGADKLAADASGPHKFVNLLAELRFAILFAALGAEVSLLRDQQFGTGDVYTPDVEVVFRNELRILVEVVRLSDGSPTVTDALEDEISAAALPLRVDHSLGEKLSAAAISGDARREHESLTKATVREAVAKMREALAAGHREGVVHVLAFEGALRCELRTGRDVASVLDRVPVCQSDAWIGSFTFCPTPLRRGFASGGVTAAHFLNEDGQRERLLRELRSKARKRTRLPRPYASVPFVVGVENDEFELQPLSVLSALTGSRVLVPGGDIHATRWDSPSAIQDALNSGWAPVFKAWDYDSSAQVLLTQDGAYLNKDGWASDLSGVLVTHNVDSKTQWLPNPFAHPSICNPGLQTIGLPLDKLGARLCQANP